MLIWTLSWKKAQSWGPNSSQALAMVFNLSNCSNVVLACTHTNTHIVDECWYKVLKTSREDEAWHAGVIHHVCLTNTEWDMTECITIKIVNYIYISICLQEFLHHHIQFTFNSSPFLPPLTVCSTFLASVVSSFLRREGIWVYVNSEGKVSRERGEGSDWRRSLLHSLISCGWQGSRGCTGSFPLEGAWLNSTQFLSPGWIPGFASGSCRRELKSRKQVNLKKSKRPKDQTKETEK